ncbi:MAG: hypothetical protein KGJ78_05860 [Alphaproteobacteria bacterium]|nr:hypothetical protein [Alphaproteobacteria bacterium]
MKTIAWLIAALILAPTAAAGPSMMDVAQGFYGAYTASQPSDGIPDKGQRARYAPYLSAELNGLLDQAAAAQARFQKDNKFAPPIVDGDLFTSMYEGATAVRVADCRAEGRTGTCRAELTYDDRHDAPVRWTDMLYLVMTAQGWRIDDVGYGGNWKYSNRGRLTATLRQAIANAGG